MHASSSRRWLLSTAAALGLAILSPPAMRAQTPSRTIAITGGTVITVTRGVIPNGTVLIRDGKIAAVGANVTVPAGAERLDASGKFVSPGLIDAHSHIAADSINESGTTVSSMTGIEDVFNPTDVDIYRDLAGGLTTANVLHGSANPIGGKNKVIKLRWGKTRAEDFTFEGAPPGIKFALGENPKDLGPGNNLRRYPVSRAGVEFVIRDAFTRAKAYQKSWQDYERRKKAGEEVLAPRRDLQLEPLVEVLEGKRLVHAHCYRADEILMLLRLAEEMGFKIATLQHVLEGYKVAKEIAAHGAGASTFADWWGYKIEAIDAIPYNAALMMRKGVLVSVNSDSAELARRLNTEAAKSIRWGGLTDDEALSLVTINPAKQLRIDARVGSLEAGKDADVTIWNRHPLSAYAIVERTYIDGQLYYDRVADERRLTELVKEKEALVSAERANRKPESAPRTTTGAESQSTNGSGSNGSNGTNGNAQQPALANALPPTRTAPAGVLAITNARIVPVTRPPIDRGTIVIRNGRIAEVGAGVAVPSGAQVVDAAGADVYPGWINTRSTIGLADPGASGFADISEALEFNPQLRTAVTFHSDSEAIPVSRANGVTTAAVTPSGGVLGGQVALMNLDGWTWEENAVVPNVGIAFQFPPLTAGGQGRGRGAQAQSYDDLKKARDARVEAIVRLFDQARAYAQAGSRRETDWVLDALVPIVNRQLPLVVRADAEADIRQAIAFADRQHVRMILSSGSEAALVALLLKEKSIPVILGPVLSLPTREDLSHAASYNAAATLVKAGVKVAFSTGDANYVRNLPYQAAESVAWGLPREEALKALTIGAAEILGVADRLGSIEPGKIANLLISKGDPLDFHAQITHVIINGRSVGLANEQLTLYERYARRP